MQGWNFEAVEQAFVEAALDPSLWVKALDKVTATTESYGAVLIPPLGGVLPTLPFTERIQRSFETFVKDGWHLRDERNRGIARMTQRGVVDDLDFVDRDTIAKHPYYQEFLAPHRLRWFAGVKVSSGSDLWCLSIQRTIDQQPFSEVEKDQLALLSKRLSTCAAIARALGASAAESALEAFEMSGTAVVLVDRHGKIFKANDSAQRLFVDDVQIKKGKVAVNNALATTTLNAAVSDLLMSRTSGLRAPVVLPRTNRRPLIAYPAKLSVSSANALADCCAIIIFVDLDSIPGPPATALRSVFRLSVAEARLCLHLASGEPLETAAERLGIAKETSRSQLKSIFAKIGVNRQAELVAVLARLMNPGRVSEPGN